MDKIENIDLIRKIAWSFSHTTGIDYEELFSEALVSYYEALNTYDETKGKVTTWCWIMMKQNLINFIKKEQNEQIIDIDEMSYSPATQPNLFFELKELFTEPAKHIIDSILSEPHKYLSKPPKLARGVIRDELREQGWGWVNIWNTFRQIKTILNET